MLGVVLLYVGVVLILNGIARLCKIDEKSMAVFNVFTGVLSFILNIVAVIQGNYFAAGTGLLFGFTYLFIAARCLFNLDGRLYGWYCLFVAINTIPLAFIDPTTLKFIDFTVGNIYWVIIWLYRISNEERFRDICSILISYCWYFHSLDSRILIIN